MPGSCASARLTPAAGRGRHPLVGDVERDAVDAAQRPDVQHVGARGEVEAGGHRTRGRPVAEVDDPAARGQAGFGHRRGRVPEGAQGERLVEGRPGDEPAGAAAALDQPLGPQQLERPAHGDPADAVPLAESRLALQRARRADVPESDPLPELGRHPVRPCCHTSDHTGLIHVRRPADPPGVPN